MAVASTSDPHHVVVRPGLAIDHLGRVIVIDEDQEVLVQGIPSSEPGWVFGNYLTISYAEEKENEADDGCQVKSGCCDVAWGGPTRIVARPLLAFQDVRDLGTRAAAPRLSRSWPPRAGLQNDVPEKEVEISRGRNLIGRQRRRKDRGQSWLRGRCCHRTDRRAVGRYRKPRQSGRWQRERRPARNAVRGAEEHVPTHRRCCQDARAARRVDVGDTLGHVESRPCGGWRERDCEPDGARTQKGGEPSGA